MARWFLMASLAVAGLGLTTASASATRPLRDVPAPVTPVTACDIERAPSRLEADLVSLLNNVRQNPKGFQPTTKASKADIAEANTFLRGLNPVNPLTYDPRLQAAARRQLEEIATMKVITHRGRDGSGPLKRVQDTGLWPMIVGEEISVGYNRAPDVLGGLIIDAGLPQRPHRMDLFSPRFQYAGAACGPNPQHRHACVIVLSGPIVKETAGQPPWAVCPPP